MIVRRAKKEKLEILMVSASVKEILLIKMELVYVDLQILILKVTVSPF